MDKESGTVDAFDFATTVKEVLTAWDLALGDAADGSKGCLEHDTSGDIVDKTLLASRPRTLFKVEVDCNGSAHILAHSAFLIRTRENDMR